MKSFFSLVKAEFVMLFGELKNYRVNYIFYNIGLIIFFCGMLYNYQTSFILLIALVLWQATTSSTGYLSSVIYDEAMMGTLEQIFLTKTKVQTVMASKIVVNICFTIFKSFVLLLICYCFFANSIVFSLTLPVILLIVLVFILTVFPFYMLGEFFGGLSLYYKRVSSVLNVFNNILLLFSGVFTTVDINNPIFYLTPLPSAIELIKIFYTNNYANFYYVLITFIVIGLIYCVLGRVTFNMFINKAKRDGKLNQY